LFWDGLALAGLGAKEGRIDVLEFCVFTNALGLDGKGERRLVEGMEIKGWRKD
jgi:hypothetical protein